MLKTNLGDALIWMKTAEMLYLKGTENLKEYRGERTCYPHVNELNVAAVCAGYAFEFMLKVLVEADEETPKYKHEASVTYQQLIQEDRKDVDQTIAKHG